ncbi:hypothetical protein HGRIS_002527 [Hohenbuehelia grisea]|uniref:Endoplasmic oxidoreductin n=1 Tax=Hohenbuehelia grisea TaxID=104357 RepID=A0ABR3JMP0_9AGAR
MRCPTRALALLAAFHGVAHASSFLGDTLIHKEPVQDVLQHQTVKVPACQAPPTGPIETTKCDYETVESVNKDLHANLKALVRTPFFRYIQVDLYRECPFWNVPGSCRDIQCAITTIDESEVPERWRAAALSKIEPSSVDRLHKLPGCYYRDSDFCFLDDNTEGEYYDLTLVPERFTGYAGPSAHSVWKAIYEENCFGLTELNLMSAKSPSLSSLSDTMAEPFHEPDAETGNSEQCLEKRVYYKVVSGLHASISTHICAEWLNQTTGEWSPNLQCFIQRVASHPERLRYIYFNLVLLLRAVARLDPYLSSYDYCSTGTHEEDQETLKRLENIIYIAGVAGKFDETVLFRGENANILKDEFKMHFRNVTRIMDCTGCDKCRLWGKVQTTGIATALKILFELDEAALDPRRNPNLLQRYEVVALFNTLNRFSESLEAVEDFRRMWAAMDESESDKMIKDMNSQSKQNAGTGSKAGRAQPSPLAGQDLPENLLDEARIRLAALADKCASGVVKCASVVLEVWRGAMSGFSALFKPSGKERGPSASVEL